MLVQARSSLSIFGGHCNYVQKTLSRNPTYSVPFLPRKRFNDVCRTCGAAGRGRVIHVPISALADIKFVRSIVHSSLDAVQLLLRARLIFLHLYIQ